MVVIHANGVKSSVLTVVMIFGVYRLCDQQRFQLCYKCYFCLPWGIFDKHTCGCNRKQVTSGWRMTLNVLHVLSPWTLPVTTVNGRSLISSINSLIRCSHFQTCSITIDPLTQGTRACFFVVCGPHFVTRWGL